MTSLASAMSLQCVSSAFAHLQRGYAVTQFVHLGIDIHKDSNTISVPRTQSKRPVPQRSR